MSFIKEKEGMELSISNISTELAIVNMHQK